MINLVLGYILGCLTFNLIGAFISSRKKFNERYTGGGSMYVDDFGLFISEQDKFYH